MNSRPYAQRTATVKKQQKQVRGRSAYKSFLSSFTVDNTQKLGGFSYYYRIVQAFTVARYRALSGLGLGHFFSWGTQG